MEVPDGNGSLEAEAEGAPGGLAGEGPRLAAKPGAITKPDNQCAVMN